MIILEIEHHAPDLRSRIYQHLPAAIAYRCRVAPMDLPELSISVVQLSEKVEPGLLVDIHDAVRVAVFAKYGEGLHVNNVGIAQLPRAAFRCGPGGKRSGDVIRGRIAALFRILNSGQ